MATMLDALRARGSRGVWLQMHEGNARARRFYGKLEFTQLEGVGQQDGQAAGTGGALYLGRTL